MLSRFLRRSTSYTIQNSVAYNEAFYANKENFDSFMSDFQDRTSTAMTIPERAIQRE